MRLAFLAIWPLSWIATPWRSAEAATPVATVSHNDAALAELDETLNTMQAVLDRYRLDREALDRFYGIPLSREGDRQTKRFCQTWIRRLEKMDFNSLDGEGRMDYLLFRNQLDHELHTLKRAKKRKRKMRPLLPFAETIVALEEARRRMEPIGPVRAAEQLVSLHDQIDMLRQSIEKQKRPVSKGVAHRAAAAIDGLRRTLKDWHRFYADYEPAFTRWTAQPYEQADQDLEGFAKLVREKLVGIKADDRDAIVGDPIGRDVLLSELAYEMIRASLTNTKLNRDFAPNWRFYDTQSESR